MQVQKLIKVGPGPSGPNQMVNLFVPMGGFACLTESGVCFRYVAKKTLEFLLKFKVFKKNSKVFL